MRCRWELKWHKFGLSHHMPAKFGTAQWQDADKISIPFVGYRLAVFAFFWGFFIYDLLKDYTTDGISYYMIYLTNWTYLAALTDIALQLVSAIAAAYRCRKGIKPMVPEWLYKMHWVIVNISHTIAPLVTVMYWAGVFPFLDNPVTYPDIHLHALTTLYTMSDLFIHSTPRRYHHVIYPMGFGVAYLLFSIIYYLCGGLDQYGNTGIYPILDWANVGMSAATGVVACLAVLGLHWLTWAMVRLRLRLHGRWLGRKVSVVAGFNANGGDGGDDGNGGGGGGSGAGGKTETGDLANGDRDLYVEIDIGDGGVVGKAPANGLSSFRPTDAEKAFDKPTLEVDENGGHSSGRGNNAHIA